MRSQHCGRIKAASFCLPIWSTVIRRSSSAVIGCVWIVFLKRSCVVLLLNPRAVSRLMETGSTLIAASGKKKQSGAYCYFLIRQRGRHGMMMGFQFAGRNAQYAPCAAALHVSASAFDDTRSYSRLHSEFCEPRAEERQHSLLRQKTPFSHHIVMSLTKTNRLRPAGRRAQRAAFKADAALAQLLLQP